MRLLTPSGAGQAAGSAFGGMGARSALADGQTQEGTQRQIAETTAQLDV